MCVTAKRKVNGIKRTLTMFLIFSFLVGCSAKQSPTKNQGANEARELVGTTKNINHPTPQTESSNLCSLQLLKNKKKLILDVMLIAQNPELK
jgi:uncharacterized protein YcfL